MKVSVIIPAYNESKFIAQSVRSCLVQNEVGEVIVVDDCSTDNTVSIVEDINDVRIRIIKSKIRSGPSKAINLGIENAKCELLTVLGADDYFKLGRFSENISFLNKNKDIDGTYEAVQNFKEIDSKYSTEHDVDIIELRDYVHPKDLFNYLIRDKHQYFSIISVVYRNRYENNIYNDLTLRYGQDIDFCYQLASCYSLVKIEKHSPLIMRRLHDKNNTSNSDFSSFDARKRILNKWYNKARKYELALLPTLYLIYRKASAKYFYQYKNTIGIFGYIVKTIIFIELIITDFIFCKGQKLSHDN